MFYPAIIMQKRTIIYIDGFNLYYGSLKNTPYKWLDLKTLFRHILDDSHQIICIKYYTARLTARPNDLEAPIRQDIYLRALTHMIPELEIYYGHYLSYPVKMRLAHPQPNQSFVSVIKTEEKGSDVNLALHLLNDAWRDAYDCAVVVSNDSDLAEAMRLAKEQNGKLIGLITPGNPKHRATSQTLKQHAVFLKRIRQKVLSLSQLPEAIPNSSIKKPSTW